MNIPVALNTNVNTFTLGEDGPEVKVRQYLPVADKIDMINLVLQNSDDGGYYNLIKANMYFNLYICYLYTDIEFSVEEKNDVYGTYDTLESSGIVSAVIQHMNEAEYTYLCEMMNKMLDTRTSANRSAVALINSLINSLPRNAEDAKKIIEGFDPSQFQAVIDFAKAANGNRPIPKE